MRSVSIITIGSIENAGFAQYSAHCIPLEICSCSANDPSAITNINMQYSEVNEEFKVINLCRYSVGSKKGNQKCTFAK